ncbi:hypothetical protein SAMN05444383_15110, partial [Myxococcus xanthus]
MQDLQPSLCLFTRRPRPADAEQHQIDAASIA